MTANWFEAKVKYIKIGEDGRERKVAEMFLLDAMSYTESESRIMREMESITKGDYVISNLKKSNITELVPSDHETDDRWYKAKIAIIDADEVSGKEKASFHITWWLPAIRTAHWRTLKPPSLRLSFLTRS